MMRKEAITMLVGERLASLRAAAGLSQAKLAAESGVSAARINQYEHGRQAPSLGSMEKLARALRVRVIDLVSEDTEPGAWSDLAALAGGLSERDQVLLRAVITAFVRAR